MSARRRKDRLRPNEETSQPVYPGATATDEWVRAFQAKLYHTAKRTTNRRFHSLHDKLYHPPVLQEAWRQVRKNRGAAGIDQQSIEDIENYGVKRFLQEIADDLRQGTYRVKPVRRVYIPKKDGRQRRLGIPVVKDRVCQAAAKLLLEPIFEADFLDCSYGYRPGRGPHDAIKATKAALAKGRTYVIDADIKSYFDSIPHDKLMDCVQQRIADGFILSLLRAWLRAGVLEDGQVTVNEQGTPQGGVISPLLANIYLHELDVAWERNDMTYRAGHNTVLVRYADDLVILCPGDPEIPMRKLRQILDGLELQLHPKKTRVVHANDGFDFLSVRFQRRQKRGGKKGQRWIQTRPTPEAMNHAREEVRRGTSIRGGGGSKKPDEVVGTLNRFLRGWANYFRITHASRWFAKLQRYANQKLRRWLRRRRSKHKFGYREYPDKYLYEVLCLIQLRVRA